MLFCTFPLVFAIELYTSGQAHIMYSAYALSRELLVEKNISILLNGLCRKDNHQYLLQKETIERHS